MHTTRKVFFFITVVTDLEGRARERERQSWMLGNFTFSLPGPGKLPVDCECEHLKTSISTFFPFSFWFPCNCEPTFTGEENPEKTSPRKLVPTGDRTRARCVTGAHATTDGITTYCYRWNLNPAVPLSHIYQSINPNPDQVQDCLTLQLTLTNTMVTVVREGSKQWDKKKKHFPFFHILYLKNGKFVMYWKIWSFRYTAIYYKTLSNVF